MQSTTHCQKCGLRFRNVILCCLFCSLDIELVFSIIAAMEISNMKASFPHPSKSLLAYFEIPKEYLDKCLSTEKCQS